MGSLSDKLQRQWDYFQSGFLKIFGDLKYFRWPMFIIYDPQGHKVKGHEVRQVINLIQPGDILLRGYDKYLDGLFIPGYFSHVGLYLGEVTQEDKTLLQEHQLPYFYTGEQMVVHAMAEGVFMEDVLSFCNCDRLVILRFPEECVAQEALNHLTIASSKIDFTPDEHKLFLSLKSGECIPFVKAFDTIRHVALSQVGKPYDFKFNFNNYNDLSCTEFVQTCIKSLTPLHGILALEKYYYGLFKKSVIEPDAYLRTCFQTVWVSKSVDKSRLQSMEAVA